MPAPVPSHPPLQHLKQGPVAASIRSQSVPTLLRPTGQYQFVVPPRLTQTPPPAKNAVTKADIKAAIASIDPVLLAALGNPKDRLSLTKLEMDVQRFLRNTHMTRLDFPPMSSYQRLMAHRIAEYYHMEHTAVDLDNSRRAVVLFKTVGSHCPDVQLMSIPEEEAALASGKCFPVNGKSPSPVDGVNVVNGVNGINGILDKIPEEVLEKEEEEDFEETGPYEPDPDMPPLLSAEPPKQFRILRRKPSPSPESKGNSPVSDSSRPVMSRGITIETPGSPSPPNTQKEGANSERTLEEREKEYALARARIFNYESLDGTIAAEMAGLSADDVDIPSNPQKSSSDSEADHQPPLSPPSIVTPLEELSDSTPSTTAPVQNGRFLGNDNPRNRGGHLVRNHSNGSTYYSPGPPNFRRTSGNVANGATVNGVGGVSPPVNGAGVGGPAVGAGSAGGPAVGASGAGFGMVSPVSSQPFPNSYGSPYHWGVPGVRAPNQSPNGVYDGAADSSAWSSHGCYPVYDSQWYPYFSPSHQRQVPLFVPNGMSQVIPENSYGPVPMYPPMQTPYSRTGSYSGNSKNRSHPGYPPPNVSSLPGKPPNTMPKADSSPQHQPFLNPGTPKRHQPHKQYPRQQTSPKRDTEADSRKNDTQENG